MIQLPREQVAALYALHKAAPLTIDAPGRPGVPPVAPRTLQVMDRPLRVGRP